MSEDSSLNKIKKFQQYSKKYMSQNKEAGLIKYIFDTIGWSNRKGIEIACGNGITCNLSYFVRDHDMKALFFEKNAKLLQKGREYWKDKENKPKFIEGFIYKNTVCDTIKENGFDGNIDILSLDIDGLDFWIMHNLINECEIINPRVIVLEFEDIIGPTKILTVPYKDKFSGWNKWAKGGPNYSCASLLAFTKLLKNYNLVGTENKGFNAFYIRNDVHEKISHIIPKINENEYDSLWKNLPEERQKKLKERWDMVKHLDWVGVNDDRWPL